MAWNLVFAPSGKSPQAPAAKPSPVPSAAPSQPGGGSNSRGDHAQPPSAAGRGSTSSEGGRGRGSRGSGMPSRGRGAGRGRAGGRGSGRGGRGPSGRGGGRGRGGSDRDSVDILSLPRIKLDTPADIAKWREERRKNWPSASNVARKEEDDEKKRERGQLCTDDEQSNPLSRKRPRKPEAILSSHWAVGSPGQSTAAAGGGGGGGGGQGVNGTAAGVANRPMGSLGSLCASYGQTPGGNDSDGDIEEGQMKTAAAEHDPRSTALPHCSNAVGKAADPSDSADDGAPEVHTTKPTMHVMGDEDAMNVQAPVAFTTGAENTFCRFFMRGHCSKGSGCQFSHDDAARNEQRKDKKAKAKVRQQQRAHEIAPRESTLLRKVLGHELRHEASVTLQAFRYICNNSFFAE